MVLDDLEHYRFLAVSMHRDLALGFLSTDVMPSSVGAKSL
jgi:hypothetical protein